MLRASKSRLMALDKIKFSQADDQDRRGGFQDDAAIKVVNKTSIESLKMCMFNKYQESKEDLSLLNCEPAVFRGNFMINEEFDEANCEDEFQELRIGNVMMRQVGPCIQDKSTTMNPYSNHRHPKGEPYETLCQSRKHHKLGAIFGIYLQPDIIESEEAFTSLFPAYPPTGRPFGGENRNAIVKVGDEMRIRVRKRNYYLK